MHRHTSLWLWVTTANTKHATKPHQDSHVLSKKKPAGAKPLQQGLGNSGTQWQWGGVSGESVHQINTCTHASMLPFTLDTSCAQQCALHFISPACHPPAHAGHGLYCPALPLALAPVRLQVTQLLLLGGQAGGQALGPVPAGKWVGTREGER